MSKKKEGKVPKTILMGMGKHEWWSEVCEITDVLDVPKTKPLHDALELIMPQYLEILRDQKALKEKEKAVVEKLKSKKEAK